MGDDGGDLGQEFHETRTFINDHVNNYMTTATVFDPQEELLWVGTESVKSFLSPNLYFF